MIDRASDLKWQTTDSVLEALILEADLIKKFQPIANTKEKDNKSASKKAENIMTRSACKR